MVEVVKVSFETDLVGCLKLLETGRSLNPKALITHCDLGGLNIPGLSSPKKAPRYAGEQKNKGVASGKLLVSLLSEGPKHAAELEKAFFIHTFKKTSFSPAASAEKTNGRIKDLGNGMWALTEAGLDYYKEFMGADAQGVPAKD